MLLAVAAAVEAHLEAEVAVEVHGEAARLAAVSSSTFYKISQANAKLSWIPLPGAGAKVVVEPHRHAGVFVAKGKEHLLVTRNIVPGESVYGEKRISIETAAAEGAAEGTKSKIEYRVWNPFRSKLAAGILGGLDDIHIAPGKKVLYLGAASGTSVSHVADVVGPVSLLPGLWDS